MKNVLRQIILCLSLSLMASCVTQDQASSKSGYEADASKEEGVETAAEEREPSVNCRYERTTGSNRREKVCYSAGSK